MLTTPLKSFSAPLCLCFPKVAIMGFCFLKSGLYLISSLVSFSVDATKPSNRLGRLVNDSEKGNCKMKKVIVDNVPHLCLFAIRDITINEELRYDYGINDLPWRKEVLSTTVKLNLNHTNLK